MYVLEKIVGNENTVCFGCRPTGLTKQILWPSFFHFCQGDSLFSLSKTALELLQHHVYIWQMRPTVSLRDQVETRWTRRHSFWLSEPEVVHPGRHLSQGCCHPGGRQWQHEGPQAYHRQADRLLYPGHSWRWWLFQHHRCKSTRMCTKLWGGVQKLLNLYFF